MKATRNVVGLLILAGVAYLLFFLKIGTTPYELFPDFESVRVEHRVDEFTGSSGCVIHSKNDKTGWRMPDYVVSFSSNGRWLNPEGRLFDSDAIVRKIDQERFFEKPESKVYTNAKLKIGDQVFTVERGRVANRASMIKALRTHSEMHARVTEEAGKVMNTKASLLGFADALAYCESMAKPK